MPPFPFWWDINMYQMNLLEASISVFQPFVKLVTQSLWGHQNIFLLSYLLFFQSYLYIFCELCTLWSNHKLHLALIMFTRRGTLYPLNIFSSAFDHLVNFSPSSHIPDAPPRERRQQLLAAAACPCHMLWALYGRQQCSWRGDGNLGFPSTFLLQLWQIFLQEYM